jgi:hypothetical protein
MNQHEDKVDERSPRELRTEAAGLDERSRELKRLAERKEFEGAKPQEANRESKAESNGGVLTSLLKSLRASEPLHLEIGLRMMKAADGALFPVDLLALAALNRSANLIAGFASLIEARNFIAAAPLLRLQIDNCLRFYAVHIVAKPHDFARAVLKGERIDKMKDAKGNPLTDRYLVQCVTKDFPWIARVYKKTSGYIHFSDAHVASVFSETPQEKRDKGIYDIAIGPGDKFTEPGLYEEAVEAFAGATQAIFHYLAGWVKTKESQSKAYSCALPSS